MNKEKKKHPLRTALLIIFAVFAAAYCVLTHCLVSACLVPSFMEKLDAFERITVKSYSEQIYTDDIVENSASALSETDAWLQTVNRQRVTYDTPDGYTFVSTEFLQETESHRFVILFHGYTGWKEEMYRYAYWFYNENYNVIVPDLRCSGESGGDYIGMGYTDSIDSLHYIDRILEEDPDAEIVLMGQSMGAATALMMTGNPDLSDHVKAVISDCSYTDAYSMFEAKIKDWFHLPAFPLVDSAVLDLKIRGGYDLHKASAIEAVKQSHTPTLFIHGTDDAMIPVSMVYELYDAAACKKDLLVIDGAGHAQSADKAPDTYYETIRTFLSNYVN